MGGCRKLFLGKRDDCCSLAKRSSSSLADPLRLGGDTAARSATRAYPDGHREGNLRSHNEARPLLERVLQLEALPTRRARAWRDLARTLYQLREPVQEVEEANGQAASWMLDEPRFAKELERIDARAGHSQHCGRAPPEGRQARPTAILRRAHSGHTERLSDRSREGFRMHISGNRTFGRSESDNLEVVDMLETESETWADRMRAEGRREALEGERKLLLRMARIRFGEALADSLAVPLDGIADADRLEQIGEWLMVCDSGDALLARLGQQT